MSSDERLVALLRAGDDDAFEVIYDRHHRPILAYARHMLGDRFEAEDVVQHTFFAAYRDLTVSDRDYHVRAWLFTIARNRCLTILRTRRDGVDLDEAEPSTDGLANEIERRQELRALLGDLSRLPEDQREALLLSELSAMDHGAVASVLHVPKDKVKALVFQARTTLAADRAARETSCDSIRERLATARGGELRRGLLRRHLRECESCRDFRTAVAEQRRAAAIILPVLPSAGLKAGALSAIAGGGSSAGATGAVGAGLASALGAKSVASKGLIIAAIAGTGTAGVATVDALRDGDSGGVPAGIQVPVTRDAPLTALPTHHRTHADRTAGAPAAPRRSATTGGHGSPTHRHRTGATEPGSISRETAHRLSQPAHGITSVPTHTSQPPAETRPTGEAPPVSPYPASGQYSYTAGARQRMQLAADLQALKSGAGLSSDGSGASGAPVDPGLGSDATAPDSASGAPTP
jgi:RNA polymerase sigma factor (sigma-70 family)